MAKGLILHFILIPILAHFIIYFSVKILSTILSPKYKEIFYYISMFTWMFLFSYFSYSLLIENSLGGKFTNFLLFNVLVNSLAIIVYMITFLISNFFGKLPMELITSTFLILLFSLGYYQWFIWLPRHFKKKKLNNNLKKLKDLE